MVRFILITVAIAGLVGLAAPRGHHGGTAGAAASDGGKVVKLYRESNGHFYADAEVNGTTIHFLVDTGASMVALTKEDARRVGINVDESSFGVIGSGASGAVTGRPVMLSTIKLGGKRVDDVKGAVLNDGLDVSLLGQSFLSRIGDVSISNDEMTLR